MFFNVIIKGSHNYRDVRFFEKNQFQRAVRKAFVWTTHVAYKVFRLEAAIYVHHVLPCPVYRWGWKNVFGGIYVMLMRSGGGGAISARLPREDGEEKPVNYGCKLPFLPGKEERGTGRNLKSCISDYPSLTPPSALTWLNFLIVLLEQTCTHNLGCVSVVTWGPEVLTGWNVWPGISWCLGTHMRTKTHSHKHTG